MIKLGIICPVAHLEDFASLSNFHLILPHLFDRFPEYLKFYRDRSRAGDFVLMDSSIFELEVSLPGAYLLEKAHLVEASEMTVPEVLRDAEASKRMLEEFLNLYDSTRSTVRLLAVVQGKTIEEMLEYYAYLESVEEIGTIGIPFDLDFVESQYNSIQSKTLRRVLNRWEFMERATSFVKPVHLLGLSDGVELQYYRGGVEYHIRSNDSSSAYVHGAAGIRYSDRGLPCEKISEKLDFGSHLKEYPEGLPQRGAICHNIAKLKQFAGYNESSS